MKKLKQLIKGVTIASAVVRVCVEAYKAAKAAKAEADAAVKDAIGEAVSDGARAAKSIEPFDIISVGGEVCFLDGDGDVLIVDGDGVVN